ncbi:hypothetical protein [Nocardia colli]|uniref:hypothetical protein n=1 Tax=Nocardia colli TaxID=2545717 RepID=UPI0035D997C5
MADDQDTDYVSDEESPHFDELYPALGQLLVASGRMELQVRCLVAWLAGSDDVGWIVFEGQTVEWLVSTGRALQAERMCTQPTQKDREHLERTAQAFMAAQELNGQRNFLAHGDWRSACYSEECRTRARNLPQDDRQFHVLRSRYRKAFDERVVAVSDVEVLAQQINDLANDIRVIRRAIGDMPWGSLRVNL